MREDILQVDDATIASESALSGYLIKEALAGVSLFDAPNVNCTIQSEHTKGIGLVHQGKACISINDNLNSCVGRGIN